jgi:hypothetical protein
MTPEQRHAQSLRIVGIVVFAVGAVLMGIGATMPLFLVYVAIAIVGASVLAAGQRAYNKTLKD